MLITKLILPQQLNKALAQMLKRPSADFSVAIKIASPARMAGLNYLAFGEREATDVLSFPLYKNLAEIKKTLRREKVFLGDIFICESIAKKQVARLGHSLKIEIKELAIHGLLHLLGYDHQNKKQVIKMLKAQRKIFSL